MGVENLFQGTLEAVSNARASVRVGEIFVSGMWSGGDVPPAGAQVCVAVRAERIRLGDFAGSGQQGGVNRLPCQSGVTIYKGKYVDRTLDTAIGPIKARIWDRDVDLANLAALWWREDECAVTLVEDG